MHEIISRSYQAKIAIQLFSRAVNLEWECCSNEAREALQFTAVRVWQTMNRIPMTHLGFGVIRLPGATEQRVEV